MLSLSLKLRVSFCCALLVAFSLIFSQATARAQMPSQNKDLVRADAALSAVQKRVALVIGNKDYTDAPLKNPVNDATDMAAALKALGFEVILKTNVDKRQIVAAVDDFAAKLGPNCIGLFYFSGHGVQVDGVNYLVPLNCHIERQSDVEFEAFPAQRFLSAMGQAGCPLNIIILDACRNNPLPKSIKALGDKGLGKMDAPSGTFIAYATAPGQTASDDSDKSNGLYTGVLLQKMKTPGLKIEEVFKATRVSVTQASSGKQTPWDESSLQNDFYFAAGIPAPLPNPVPAPPPVYPNEERGTSVKKNRKDGAALVYIPTGPFSMGDDDLYSNKRHTVNLSGYFIYNNLVTVAMYEKFCKATGRRMPDAPDFNTGWGKKDHPIVNVTWDDANAYCDWAGAVLPSEAQWEKAARGTDGRKYPWGNTFDMDKLWCSTANPGDTGGTRAAGSFPSGASPYGVLDMAGNVWEWCADWYDVDFGSSRLAQQTDPLNGSIGKKEGRSLRGGSWFDTGTEGFRCAYRGWFSPNGRNFYNGFRCVIPGN